MKFLLNSCEVKEIQEIADWGFLDGVTMNPTMVAALNRDYVKNLKDICSIVDIPVFAQVVSTLPEKIVEEAKALSAIDKKIVVKVHMNAQGTKAIRRLKELGIPSCATGMHTVVEALAAERAGAGHVAMFVGLLGEVDEAGTDDLIAGTREAFDKAKSGTQIMAAVRSINQLVQAARLGADEMTAPTKIWRLIFENGYTKARWTSFIGDWTKSYGDRNWISGY
jgi:transaldolase